MHYLRECKCNVSSPDRSVRSYQWGNNHRFVTVVSAQEHHGLMSDYKLNFFSLVYIKLQHSRWSDIYRRLTLADIYFQICQLSYELGSHFDPIINSGVL